MSAILGGVSNCTGETITELVSSEVRPNVTNVTDYISVEIMELKNYYIMILL